MSEENNNEELETYRSLNSMIYSRPSAACLVSESVVKLNYFTQLSTSLGSTMQVVLNSGGEYLWGKSCYLKLKVGVTSCTADTILNGSICQLISAVRATHRSGEQLEYYTNSDILSKVRLLYNTSYNDYVKLHTLVGSNANPEQIDVSKPFGTDAIGSPNSPKYFDFNIPLSLLFGLFNTDTYMPPQLCAGMRLEFILNPNVLACGFAAANNVVLASIEPVLALHCNKVYDEISRQVAEESGDVSQSGIQFSYSTYFSSVSQQSGGAVNIDCLLSASLTEGLYLVNSIDTDTNKYVFRTLNPASGNYSYQFRLGATYFPIYGVTNDNEAYFNTLTTFSAGYHQTVPNSGVSVGSFDVDKAVYSTMLERTSMGLALYSGQASNNSRILNFSAANVINVNLTSTIFLKYCRVANLMQDSCVVDR